MRCFRRRQRGQATNGKSVDACPCLNRRRSKVERDDEFSGELIALLEPTSNAGELCEMLGTGRQARQKALPLLEILQDWIGICWWFARHVRVCLE